MTVKIGIVGTGMIADTHARAMRRTEAVTLHAVSSRHRARAEAFTARHPGARPVEGIDALLASGVDAVYVATPTAAKESLALQAIDAGKHVIVDKPLSDAASARRIAARAEQAGVAAMDATHFTHHPRTQAIRDALAGHIGAPLSMHTIFNAHLTDRSNIRFDTALEPMGALGDLGWYCLRAAVEYLPNTTVSSVMASARFDDDSGALLSLTGLLCFEDGVHLTLDCSFQAGTMVQELNLIGDAGAVYLDDFAHDWAWGQNDRPDPGVRAGYTHHTGRQRRADRTFIATPAHDSHVVLMLEAFAALVTTPTPGAIVAARQRMVRTQALLDAVWGAATSRGKNAPT